MVARDSFVPRLVATLYCSSGLVGSLVGGWVGLGWVGLVVGASCRNVPFGWNFRMSNSWFLGSFEIMNCY